MITQLTELNSSSNNNNAAKLSVFYPGAATLTGHSVQLYHAFDPVCERCVVHVCVREDHAN